MKYLMLVFTLLISGTAFAQHSHSSGEAKPVTLMPGLGDVHHPVSTQNSEAQKFFNQGLAYIYAFNHEEAVRSFKRATELDSQMAMGYWGIALALGSNYNLQADAPQLKEAYAALQKALSFAGKASDNERGYIEALSKRYTNNPQADLQKLAVDYKNAMRELVKRFPDDLDAATLYAESCMNLRPWKLWSADGKPAEGTLEIIATLESVLRRNPKHTGANHYYIHAIEASPNPERGLASALRLEGLAPAAGHLVHMPSHIYIRTGDYEDAARSNAEAIVADRKYIEKSGAQGVYPMMYYNHNIHFLASAHAMNGRYADAIKTAKELEANIKPHLKAMPMLEMFAPYTTVVLVRFHKWQEILRLPEPERELKITSAFRHFARGLAYSKTAQIENAKAELKALRDKVQAIPADVPLGNSTAVGVLQVADHLLAGQIAFAQGDNRAAIERLQKGVEAEDAVNYNEPSDWDLPVREWLGGLLLVSGEHMEAEKIFRAELAKHPRNGRALFGLLESLKRQGKNSSAHMVQREFDKAWEKADTRLSIEEFYETRGKTTLSQNRQAQPLRFANVQLKTGVRLHYAEQGKAVGQPIIFLHGYTDSWFSFSRVLPLFDANYHVYALDLRGHGNSERPANGYDVNNFAADVLAFMDAMNLNTATLVGHSMGSFIAQQVAYNAPQRVARLVLIGSATTVRNQEVLDFQQAVNKLTDPVPAQFVREFQVGTAHEPLPKDFLEQVVTESLKLPASVWRAVLAGLLAHDSKHQLATIKVQTLILWGNKDAFFPQSEQQLLVTGLAKAVLKVYPDVGHSPHWERPQQIARDIEEFLALNRSATLINDSRSQQINGR
jgi:pimeloyl-ACP methyl ester carboxylesterase